MPYIVIGVVGSLVVLVNAVLSTVPTYRFSPLFLVPAIWAPYWLRRKLDLAPAHYAMWVSAILMHDLGAYGWYQRSPLPFSFDILVHFYFAFAIAFGIHRFVERKMNLRSWQGGLVTVLFMMGLGALHEIMEYSSFLMLGEKHGMLKPETSYFFDTQRDLSNNLFGTLLALGIIAVARMVAGFERETQQDGSTALSRLSS